MSETHYYNWEKGVLLSAVDGCPWDEWMAGSSQACFAIHPCGFPVFLNRDEIGRCDEYAGGDPYGVAKMQALGSAFHRRRCEMTLELVKMTGIAGREHPSVLDVGCGEGHITAELAKSFPTAKVFGLDYSLLAIRQGADSYPEIDFAVASAYAPPYRPEVFDVIVANNLWEHVPDPLRLLASLNRVLSPNGVIIISTPSRYRLHNLLRVLRGRPVQFMSELHVTEYTVGQVLEQLQFGGFTAQVYSRHIPLPSSSFFKHAILATTFLLTETALRITDSHHSLEETVFYLARKARSKV